MMITFAAEMPQATPDAIVRVIAWINAQFPFVGTLLLVMLIDVLTGLCAAIITKTVSSSVSWRGMGRKVIMLLEIGLGAVLEPFAGDIPLSKLVAGCFMVTEIISITENSARAGVPIPKAFRDVLEKLRTHEMPQTQPSPAVQINTAGNVDVHTESPAVSGAKKPDSKVFINTPSATSTT